MDSVNPDRPLESPHGDLDESTVEDATLAWLESLGWTVKHGPEIAPGELAAERQDYGQVVLEDRLRQALVRLNPTLPSEAIEDAFRKLTRPERPTLEARNRALHRLLVDGVTGEFRRPDSSIAGAQARVLDFENADNNDWLAVNQFAVSQNKHTRRPDVMLFVNGLPLVLIENFIVFEDEGRGPLVKRMAGYHQFHAVTVAVTETLRAARVQREVDRIAEERGRYESGWQHGGEPGDRRIGVV